MIKRQFYSIDHPNDNDGASDNSSSSSEDDPEPTHELSTDVKSDQEEEATAAAAAEESPESGYQSENSSDSDEEFNATEAWPGQLTSDDNGEAELLQDGFKQNRSSDLIDRENTTISTAQEKHSNQWAEAVEETEKDRALHNLDDCVIKCKSVFKCKLCPRIVCLSVDTMEAHLVSKRHARSQKLFAEGRLKLMLNSDGEVEEDAETHAERHARIVAAAEVAQPTKNSKKRNRGRQRQKQRTKKKKTCETGSKKAQVKFSSEASTKKINAGKI